MKNYESVFILNPDVTEEQVKNVLEDIKKLVEVKEVHIWGKKKLAYPVKKQTEGYFVHFEFQNEIKKNAELEKYYKNNELIIKYIVVQEYNN